MRNYNLKEWKEKFNLGEFENSNFETQVKAGWYDWFCKTTSLRNKTKKLGNIVKKLVDSEKVYVWFKNNCPFVRAFV